MLHNLVIDIVANCVLVFAWTREDKSDASWSVMGEDPVSGAPFIYVDAFRGDVFEAGRIAWRWLAEGNYLDLRPATSGLPSITTVWGRDFGVHFARALALTGVTSEQVSGVEYLTFAERPDRKVTRP